MQQIFCELYMKENHIRNLCESLGIQCFPLLFLSQKQIPDQVQFVWCKKVPFFYISKNIIFFLLY